MRERQKTPLELGKLVKILSCIIMPQGVLFMNRLGFVLFCFFPLSKGEKLVIPEISHKRMTGLSSEGLNEGGEEKNHSWKF